MIPNEEQKSIDDKSPWHLFGVDLRTLGKDWLRAMASLHKHAPLAWFEPALVIKLQNPDGEIRYCTPTGGNVPPQAITANKETSSEFSAICLPDELVLSKHLILPALPANQIREAVWLDIHSASPFPQKDIAWGYLQKENHTETGQTDVWMAFASRQQVSNYLESKQDQQWPIAQSEIWVQATPAAPNPIVLQGYGEQHRHQYINKKRLRVWSLLSGAALVLLAVLVTPTMQLHLQAKEAEAAYDQLHKKTQKLTEERDSFARTLEDLETVKNLESQQFNALEILKTLTEALPPNTYLNNFKWEGNAIEINAFADDAAATLQKLAQTDNFEDVRFLRAVTRQQNLNKDSFSAQLNLKPGSYRLPMAEQHTAEGPPPSPSSQPNNASTAGN